MLARGLRFGLAGLLLTGLCWFAAVLWWQSRPQLVGTGDLLLGFVALPLAVCGVALVGWLVWRRVSAPPATPAAGEPEVAAAASVSTKTPEALVLAVGVSTAAGESAEGLIELIAAGELRPEPVSEFLDSEGLPVRLKHSAELSLDELDEWLGDEAGDMPVAFKRALALLPAALDPVLRDLADVMPPPVSAHAAPRALPVLVRVLVPNGWSEAMLAHAQRWVERRISLAWVEAMPPLRLTAAGEAAHAQAEIGAWLKDTAQMRSLLLVALDSVLDQAAIEALDARGELFRHDRPEGRVPGEAAAAILLSRPGMSFDMQPLARLRPPLHATRDAAPRAGGRVDSALIETLIGRCFESAGTGADQLAALVCDGDVRPSRGVEIASAMNSAFPQLDPVADRIGVGAALGDLGAASATLALALAASQARLLQKPVLLATLADPLERSVSLLQPYTPEPATS